MFPWAVISVCSSSYEALLFQTILWSFSDWIGEMVILSAKANYQKAIQLSYIQFQNKDCVKLKFSKTDQTGTVRILFLHQYIW